jgi:gluconate 2-dehydrogenase gamma chain
MEPHSRRDLIRLAAGAVAAAPLAGQSAPAFFTPTEFRIVDELSEIIIPADDHSPGARAAQVAAYIDRRLAESFDEAPRQEFRDGLQVVDKLCREMHGMPFLEASPEQRVAVVARMARNEKNPKKPEEVFFAQIKGRTAQAYYSSKIGIHQEIEYKGNTMLNEFVGFDVG